MPEYIEREKLPQEVSADGMSDTAVAFAAGYNTCLEHVKSIPAADARPVVRGRWIPDYDYTEYDYDGSTPLPEPREFQDGWQCSLCGGYTPSKTHFCPNCGAMMEES